MYTCSPTSLALPGLGVLPVNAYVLLADEPVLIDAGIGLDGDDFIDALASIIDPAALRWVWLTHDDAEVPPAALAGGMQAWPTADSPWAHLLDRQRFAEVLEGVRRLSPTQIYSSHLPAASGTSLERFLQVLESVPDAEPAVAPDHAQFAHMMAAMAGAPPVAAALA